MANLTTAGDIATQRGLVGFFDVLGYKSILENNQVQEAVTVIGRILETTKKSQEANDYVGGLIQLKLCDHVIFSDSILVYCSFNDSRSEATSAALFASYCAGLMTELFWEGLPVRGALASGEYFVQSRPGSVCFAGKPIVEAYELSSALGLAACAVGSSAQHLFSTDLGFLEYSVPMKGQSRQNTMLLNHYAIAWGERELSRSVVADRFSAYRKPVGIEVVPKIDETLKFLEACKDRITG